MKLKEGIVWGAAAIVCLSSAHAEDDGDKVFSVSGFGSLGAVHSSYKDADFKGDDSVPKGSGRSSNWSETQMSRLGLQIDAQFSQELSAAVQGVSEYNYSGSYKPELTLAFLKYQITPNVAVRGGRFVMPAYMLSQYSRVGYALPWARPPLEMYRSFPTVDGADLTTKFNHDGIAYGTQFFYGRSAHKGKPMPGVETSESILSPVWGLNATADVGASTFRVAYIEAEYDIHGSAMNNLLNSYRAAGLGALADQYQPKDKTVSYAALGYAYDPGEWFLRAEIGKTQWKSDTVMPAFTNGYITVGYRFGPITPYVIYGREKNDHTTSIGAVDTIGAINTALKAADGSRHSVSLGMRWDFRDNMDLKLQLSRITRDTDTSHGGLSYQTTGSDLPSSYSEFFAGIDFVF